MNYTLTYDQYQQGLEQGKFLGLKCNSCNAVTFPPMAVCRECSGSDCGVTELKGEGTLKTFTVIRVAPEGRKPPYLVAIGRQEAALPGGHCGTERGPMGAGQPGGRGPGRGGYESDREESETRVKIVARRCVFQRGRPGDHLHTRLAAKFGDIRLNMRQQTE